MKWAQSPAQPCGVCSGFWCFSEKVFGVLFAFFLLGLGVWLWNPHGFGLVVYYLLIIYVSAFSLVGFSLLEISFGFFKLGSFTTSSLLENENCRDKNAVNGANFLIDLKVPLYREITT